MRLTMLGCGHAMATRLYNTCFVLTDDDGFCLLTDAGGGNQVLSRLKEARIEIERIHHVFVTHAHMDHILGVPWVIRQIMWAMRGGAYEGEAWVYGHDEVIELVRLMLQRMLAPADVALLGSRLHLTTLCDGQALDFCGHTLIPFDIASTKARQLGYALDLGDGETLTCLGDEPLSEAGMPYAKGATWLLSEAFCLRSEANLFRPYEKHHSTAADAAEAAERAGAENLVLYHSEDTDPASRPARYAREAAAHFSGTVFVPTDLDVIDLQTKAKCSLI